MTADTPTPDVTAHGRHFWRRNSESMPWRWRPANGCRHDEILIEYDDPIVQFLEALADGDEA